jgi:hypothetical protein
METTLAICAGVGLSAACGFRVFVPLLMLSIGTLSGHLHLSPEFQWIGSYPALITFALATILEITAYYIPWLDHILDTITTPAAVIAGILVTVSVVHDMSPFMKWVLALIAGGGSAGLVQLSTVRLRSFSLGSTGGVANPVVATAELGGSILTSLIAVIAPILVVVALIVFALFFWKKCSSRHATVPLSVGRQ